MTKDKKNKPISVDVMNKNQDLLQTVRDFLEKEDRKRLKLFLSNLHPSEIADLIESMPSAIRLEFWNGLDTSVRGNVLAEASAGVRSTLLKQIDAERVVTETSNLDTDELADVSRPFQNSSRIADGIDSIRSAISDGCKFDRKSFNLFRSSFSKKSRTVCNRS
jgi:Mg/Co/Ni transporter MgtE